MRRTLIACALGLCVAIVGSAPRRTAADDTATTGWGRDRTPTAHQERRLVQGLVDIQQGRLEDAQRQLSFLVDQQPDFRLAQLVYGDLLMARAGLFAGFGRGIRHPLVVDYRREARARLARYRNSPPPDGLPDALLEVPPSAPAAVVVDLSSYRLYVFENNGRGLQRGRDFYISIGKGGADKRREGDEKTPVGIYLVSSYLPGSELPDLYGVGAFPVNYPNGWDRLHGRTGSGIWIHGTESDRYSRPPQSSRGCVTLANQDFGALREQVEVGRTPVVLSRRVRWVSPAEREARRAEIVAAVEGWRRDWESRDSDRYLGHYAPDFRTPGMNFDEFSAYKRQVNAAKDFIEVDLDEIGMYAYPAEDGLVLVEFTQRYRSDSYSATRRKHQYWRRDGDTWRIVLEEGV